MRLCPKIKTNRQKKHNRGKQNIKIIDKDRHYLRKTIGKGDLV